jgi:hypothetical protein
MDHLGKTIHIRNDQQAVPPLDDADPRQATELAGYSLSMGTDAACDVGVSGRRHDVGDVAL